MFDRQPMYIKALVLGVFMAIVILVCYIGYTVFEYEFGETYQYGYVPQQYTETSTDKRVEEAEKYTTLSSDTPSQRDDTESPTFDMFGDQNHLSVIPSNTKAWLVVDGVDIHDPVMQSTDNNFYLTHDELGRKSIWGCYYFTANNDVSDLQNLNRKTIIFGHSNGNMANYKFSTLKHFKDASFSTQNQYIHLTINGITSKWQIFAAGDVPLDAETFMDVEPTDDAFREEVLKFKEYSYNKFECPVQYGDHILVLCTCTGGKKYDTRFLVCAKLVA